MYMLPIVIVLCAAVFIIVMLVKSRRSGNGGKGRITLAEPKRTIGRVNKLAPWPAVQLPEALGVPSGHPARTAAERLEEALDEHFESRVKDRVLKGHTRLADREWDWTWFELKRYFLICGIAKGVPMYSSQADELWHEMLMFTREYEQFCEKFCGTMIHHAPHEPGARPSAGERAWFDWLYGELFPTSPVSGRVWGAFYRTPLSGSRLQELASISGEQMKEKWFNTRSAAKYADLNATVEYLIRRARFQVDAAVKQGDSDWAGSGHYNPALSGVGLLSGMLILHSVTNPNDYAREMDRLQTEEQRKDNGGGSSGTSCSSVHDDRHSDESHDGHGGDSGGHDSGGGGDSGGSSCGSSCGGGGCSS